MQKELEIVRAEHALLHAVLARALDPSTWFMLGGLEWLVLVGHVLALTNWNRVDG